jgi:DNA-binding NarL/FixJ family response regulator
MPSHIYIVEDQDLMRQSMRAYLDGADGLEVVGVAESAEEALDDLQGSDPAPDLVLIDVALPGVSGIELLRRLNDDAGLSCLMLSGHAEQTYVEEAKAAGARGYVMKGEPEEYHRAVMAILDGGTYRSETVAAMWDRAAGAADVS